MRGVVFDGEGLHDASVLRPRPNWSQGWLSRASNATTVRDAGMAVVAADAPHAA
jgi:hypothetical protein